MSHYVVYALYKFVTLDDYQTLRQPLLDELNARQVRGTLLLAREGINGTISGTIEAMDHVIQWLRRDPRLADLEYKTSTHDEQPFHRTKVKLKKEIVTMGVDNIDPTSQAGTYVTAAQWNELISDPETLLIDTRNDYEYEIGTFKQAINPHTDSFREFPEYVQQHLDPARHKKVAMFCTGGIRCEKASSYLKLQGFDEVYHLQGGILKYLEEIEPSDSLWQGECFVFDDRVAVGHDLQRGSYDQCHACRYPITEQDKQQPEYVQGVSCPRCHDQLSERKKAGFAERERQVRIAKSRQEQHIGADAQFYSEQHRQQKRRLKHAQTSTKHAGSKPKNQS